MNMDRAVERQRRFFDSGRTKDYAFRRTALLKLQAGIRQYERELVKALQKDLHKSPSESYMAELGMTLSELSCQLRHLRCWMGIRTVRTPLAQFPARNYTVPEPYGVVLIMAPWNYPVLLCLEPLIDAIAAGNCVVLKPSSDAPAVSKVLAKLLGEIFPTNYVLVAEGGREVNERLLDCRFDKIFFTGGKKVGRLVLEKAAADLTPVTLELGGKSPCIVDDTANLRLAARRIAFGKLLNSGQTCVAPDYLILYESIREPFLKYLKQEIQRMTGEDPFANPDYPRMVNEKHYDRVMRLIEGEHICLGGYGNRETLQIAPTVLDSVAPDSPVMQEEIFGPVLPILTVASREEICGIVRRFDKPLACHLFTGNREMKRWVLRNISFGGGCINDTVVHLATTGMGFGGVGGSGMGSYHGKDGFECFSHRRSISDRGVWLDIPLRYQPYRKWKDVLIRMFMR